MPITDTSVSGPAVYIIYVIIASFYIFYASSVVLTIFLLKKPSNWSRIWTRIYYNNTFKRLQVLFLLFKPFLKGLNKSSEKRTTSLQGTNGPSPKCPLFGGFTVLGNIYCKSVEKCSEVIKFSMGYESCYSPSFCAHSAWKYIMSVCCLGCLIAGLEYGMEWWMNIVAANLWKRHCFNSLVYL